MLKILDRYIIKKFLTTFFFIISVIMLIAVIFDISEQIDEFVEKSAPLSKIIFDYYVNFIIFYSNLFSSLIIFIAVIFFTSKMASNSEIIAILGSGVSYNRMLVPYFIAASILAVFSLYANHYLIPKANKIRLEFEEIYIRNHQLFRKRNIQKQINPGEFVFIGSYNRKTNTGFKFSLEKWGEKGMETKIMADVVKYDTTTHKWILQNYFIRKFVDNQEYLHTGTHLDTTFNLNPKEFSLRLSTVSTMTTPELTKFIEKEQLRGSEDIPFFLIEKYQRTSYPMATYVLTLIGVSIAGRKQRGGIGLHIALGLLICVSYILAMKVTTVYATNAGLNPFIAVWLPNVFFAFVAVYLYKKAPK